MNKICMHILEVKQNNSMSRIVKLILILVTVSQIAVAQAPKKANTIIITTSDPAEKVFERYLQFLDDGGYLIRSKEEFTNIKTSAKQFRYDLPGQSAIGYLEMNLKFEDVDGGTKVIFTGFFNDLSIVKPRPVANKGSSRVGIGLAWRLMNDVAIKYPGGKIEYSIQ